MNFLKDLWNKIKSWFTSDVKKVEDYLHPSVSTTESTPVDQKPFQTVGMTYGTDSTPYVKEDQVVNPNNDRKKDRPHDKGDKVPYNAADWAASVAKFKSLPTEQEKYNYLTSKGGHEARAIMESGYWPWEGKNKAGEEVSLNYAQWLQAALYNGI